MRESEAGSAEWRIMKPAENRKEFIFYVSIWIVSVLFFTLVGEKGYYEYPDSQQYIGLSGGQGIMPVYPLFIHFHRMLLGDGSYLYGVVFSQTVLTIVCLMIYMIWIRKRFHPGYAVSGLVYLVSLVPFTTDLPTVMSNHAILTEALTYPLYYLFAVSFIETMIQKKYRWVCINFVMGIILALIRTQMQLCFVFNAIVLLYVVWRKNGGKKAGLKICRIFTALVICVVIVLAGELLILQVNGRLQEKRKKYHKEMLLESDEIADENKNVAAGKKQDNSNNVTGQFDSILIDRTFYEMDREDEMLFSDPEIRKLYIKIFEAADREESRYVYAGKGLWKWKDIMNGTAEGTYVLKYGWKDYLEENPDSPLADQQVNVNRTLYINLLKAHWPRMLYHTLCILPQGFICTVFFQMEEVYGLCHLYTLLLYLGAIVLIVFGFEKKRIMEERIEFMLGILTLNVLMVGIISVMFFGMQRYLIYGFGVFYSAYLLVIEQLWKAYGRSLWMKVKSRF